VKPPRIAVLLLPLLGALTACARPAAISVPQGPIAASEVRAQRGMVASASAPASRAGVEILRRGGNAIDAAVAVGFAMAVTYPAAGNLGGGGFMVVRLTKGESAAVDYRETAPRAAHRDMYLDPSGAVRPEASTVGPLAAGVPGTVAGFALAHRRWGRLPWRDVVDGFPVSRALARSLRGSDLLARFEESRRIFQRNGDFYREGEVLRQPELAETLRRIQVDGPRGFYEGWTAALLATHQRAAGGLITTEDLKRYRPLLRKPVHGTYRGYVILSMPPPSSGGAVLIEMLNVLERSDLARFGPTSAERAHLLVETMRRAFADRAEFFGDPAFVSVPVKGLTSKAYAAGLARSIDNERASSSDRVGHGRPPGAETVETTHYSVVDAGGNAVANTYTLNGAFGSGMTVPGAGFLLNNEMDDFTSKPGAPNLFGLIQGEANAIVPGKRPLSSMSPTIVLKDGRLAYVIGSPGGPTIINSVLQVIVNLIDHGMRLQQAVDAPRLHHQWKPDQISYEPGALPAPVMQALNAKGHRFAARPGVIGDVQAIGVDAATGERIGATDPRSPDGLAVGY
jgi:gamma-glutamyltranspeptidase/glutathione hydrolase